MIILLAFFMYKIYYSHEDKYISIFENKNEYIYFMTHIETSTFLLNDNDKYVRNMSIVDLYARKVKSHQEYLQKIADTSISFTQEQKQKLTECSKKADTFFKTLDLSDNDYYTHINITNVADIPWKFALTYNNNNKIYEDGLPHTREDIIFLSKEILNYNDIDLISTLIHEKVHLFQRHNSNAMQQVINKMNFSALEPYQLSKHDKELIRANPDLDNKIYYDNRSNKIMLCKYNSYEPKNISDVEITNFSIEHPYEKMAYDIAGMFYKNNLSIYKNV